MEKIIMFKDRSGKEFEFYSFFEFLNFVEKECYFFYNLNSNRDIAKKKGVRLFGIKTIGFIRDFMTISEKLKKINEEKGDEIKRAEESSINEILLGKTEWIEILKIVDEKINK